MWYSISNHSKEETLVMENLIRDAMRREKKKLLKKKGVIAVGMGIKVIDGKVTDHPCIVVSVERKLTPSEIKSKDMVPMTVGAVLTDVIESRVVKALHTQKHRPVPGGVSGGHLDATGTLGGLARKGSDLYILSNNHVLALSNQADIGDPVLQPGGHDGGEFPRDHIGSLAAFVPIQMSGVLSECPIGNFFKLSLNLLLKLLRSRTRFQIIKLQKEANLIDAALAQPLDMNLVSEEILGINGLVKGIVEATLGMEIQGSSRTSGVRFGTIDQIDVTVKVQYGEGKVALFEDQLLSNTMKARGGDSGTYVLSKEGHLTGLLFAGSETVMIANRIQNVATAFDLQF